MTLDEGTLARIRRIAEAALERKARDVIALDLKGLTSFADAFVIASGSSDRQVGAIAEAIIENLAATGEKPLGVEGREENRWVLIDLGDVVVHVFVEEAREHYDLERLWGDAAAIEFDETPTPAAEGSAP